MKTLQDVSEYPAIKIVAVKLVSVSTWQFDYEKKYVILELTTFWS
jgi:hypothetical protein